MFQSLVGCWICEKALALATNEDLPCTLSLAQEIQRHLDHKEQDPVSAFLQCDAALLLVSVGILRALHCASESLEFFIQNLLTSTKMHIPQKQLQEQSVELFTIYLLLNQLRLYEAPGEYTFHFPPAFLQMNVFQVEDALIRSLAAEIAAATNHGQKTLIAEQEALSQLVVGLPIWTLFYLRQYNLEMGALLLRTMSYLHMKEDTAFQMGLSFICDQQQLAGYFGFLGLEVSKLRMGKVNSSFDEVLDLYLPLTLSCLWTIAEAIPPNFVLFRSVS